MTNDSFSTSSSGRSSIWSVLLPFAVFLVGVALLAWYVGTTSRPRLDPTAKLREVEPAGERTSDEQRTIELFKSTKDSVVNIELILPTRSRAIEEDQTRLGTGSGFVWRSDGYIVTNFHVIAEALRLSGRPDLKPIIRVTLADRSTHSATIIGAAAQFDLAVLQIPSGRVPLKPIKLGTSSDLEVGQAVYAIGNPFGLSLTLTRGIISALDREITSVAKTRIDGVIQTDAAINPGNSGGPLLDSAGRLIGVNTAIYSPSGASAGIGFAIPADTVNAVVTELIQSGRPARPYLGVKLAPEPDARRILLTEYEAERFPVSKGAVILEVVPDGAAAKAGLRAAQTHQDGRYIVIDDVGDVIVAIDGKTVSGNSDLVKILMGYRVGQTVKVTVIREGKPVDVPVTLQGA